MGARIHRGDRRAALLLGPAAAVCCDALNFFTSAASAQSRLAQHPDVQGKMVDQARAEQIGRQTFGAVPAAD
ncbi:organomercurial lyase [Streptomyces sp. NPDC021622]|uniref:organomercurial lyase n=1 Tax=Streptomyces sp. NPDC021622 TaxID=3155013 RepID=UPI0033D8023C